MLGARLTFFGPMYAMINLFIHCLDQPQDGTLRSDLAILDIGAGYFAGLQLATDSVVSIPFARELAALAHETSKKSSRLGNPIVTSNHHLPVDTASHRAVEIDVNGTLSADQLEDLWGLQSSGNSTLLEPENWSIFLRTSFDDNNDDIFGLADAI